MSTLPQGLMIGPGSQPEEHDGSLSYMPMPSGMTVFSTPNLPEAEDAAGLEGGRAELGRVSSLLSAAQSGSSAGVVDITSLDHANRAFVDQVLGEGEVSIVAGPTHQAQESVLAGVWRIRVCHDDGTTRTDLIEVADFPVTILSTVFDRARPAVEIPDSFGPNVFNAPALLAEINEHAAKAGPGVAAHVINLSLLPHTQEDLDTLARLLGTTGTTILSRGYGNCRVTSTAVRNVWWVQYYNSQDTMILNSIEITPLPEIVMAAPEDLHDSADRLREILEVYQ